MTAWRAGRGGAGADSLEGELGADTAVYAASAAGVTITLSDGTATGGDAQGDTLDSIENLIGSDHADTLTGDANNNILEGRAGADTLDGGGGTDTLSYAASASAVTINLSDGTAAGSDAQGDTFESIENLIGSDHADSLTGDTSDNFLEGLAGADALDGGEGTDTAVYAASAAGVTVNLSDGTATGGDAEGDILDSIENLIGSAHADTLTGDANNNVLEGRAGADTLDGGGGIDTVSYAASGASVTVRLIAGTGERGDAEGDTLSGIENLIGSPYIDSFGGDAGNNVLQGGGGNDGLWGSAGDDELVGGPGADRLNGGHGQDTAAYTYSSEAVTVRLHSFSAMGGDATGDTFPTLVDVAYTDASGATQTDRLPDVEHLSGSAHDDILAGDRRDNDIRGQAGNDTLYGGPGGGDDALLGGEGNDRLYGGQGNDTLSGDAGNDSLYGGPGDDTFVVAPGNGNDVVMDFGRDTDRIDLTAFDLENVNDLTITSGNEGVTIDLGSLGGGTILLADVTDMPQAADFLI